MLSVPHSGQPSSKKIPPMLLPYSSYLCSEIQSQFIIFKKKESGAGSEDIVSTQIAHWNRGCCPGKLRLTTYRHLARSERSSRLVLPNLAVW
jgi:hypothetical protein